MSHASRMTESLRQLGKAQQRAQTRRACANGVSLFCLAATLALGAAQGGWTRTALTLFTLGALGGGLFVVVHLWRLFWRYADPDVGPARLAERLAPELGTAATSAVVLSRQLSGTDVSFSRPLALAHLERTTQALGGLDLEARLDRHLHPTTRRWRLTLCGAMAVLALLTWRLDAGRARLRSVLIDPRAARLSDVPLAADIQLTYHFPAYTGLSPRVVEGGDGSIQAIVGTEVELRAVADQPVRRALVRLENMAGGDLQDVPLVVESERHLQVTLPVVRDGRYHFVMVDADGDLLEDRGRHPIRALLDEFPQIHMDDPSSDVELRDNQMVDVHWHAQDDFGISDVALVVERDGVAPLRLPVVGDDGTGAAHPSGIYHWQVAALELKAGQEARFHLEATDNDAISGPKKSVSASHRLLVYSARQHHEEILTQEHTMLDALVDWLGQELVTPFPRDASGEALTAAISGQAAISERIGQVLAQLHTLLSALHDDPMTGRAVVAAWNNVREHIENAQSDRLRTLAVVRRDVAGGRGAGAVAAVQNSAVAQLEKDIIYLDDLLALARIDELKTTAKDLLTAQHALQELLQQYRETQDPALRAELQSRIADLKQKMLDLLAKMGSIKQSLPGEYRNMEAVTTLKLDEQLGRLEKQLAEGDLDAAAQEMEQLANMVENMVNSINDAEDQYGGERYKGMREELANFAREFKQLENEQQALSERTEEMLKNYRKNAIERAGNSLDNFVQKAREKTKRALQELDTVGAEPEVGRQVDRDLEAARQGLLDLDALLAHRDFAEARQVAQATEVNNESLHNRLQNSLRHDPTLDPHAVDHAARASEHALEESRAVMSMLDKLFPEASQVLSPEQMAQLQRMGKKQHTLEEAAHALEDRMSKLSAELPLFGGEPRQNLGEARDEMGQAADDIQNGSLPSGAAHGRRAVDQLGKLRQALEQASRGGSGKGLPLPLGGSGGPGQQNGGGYDDAHREDVEIPKTARNPAGPRFRQDLLEAAKQKPPAHYEDAVRRYYEELIR